MSDESLFASSHCSMIASNGKEQSSKRIKKQAAAVGTAIPTLYHVVPRGVRQQISTVELIRPHHATARKVNAKNGEITGQRGKDSNMQGRSSIRRSWLSCHECNSAGITHLDLCASYTDPRGATSFLVSTQKSRQLYLRDEVFAHGKANEV